MIAEDYVSFETAKLLKEKGFDWEESPFYTEQDRDEWRQQNSYTIPNPDYNPDIPFDCETQTMVAPHVSLQMAMKWLREKYNQNITVKAHNNVARLKTIYYAEVQNLSEPTERGFCVYVNGCTFEDTYEKACEAAIKYCLGNLI